MKFLLDEMFPQATCRILIDHGHDAVHVRDRGVDARPDHEVAAIARAEDQALVTENVKDFAAQHDLVVVCVLKSRLRARGMAESLATMLRKWVDNNPRPYRGLHWP